ncbi:hypothetical protein ACLKA6_015983 [Drosophila palustris]
MYLDGSDGEKTPSELNERPSSGFKQLKNAIPRRRNKF